jgi:isochorismate synthase
MDTLVAENNINTSIAVNGLFSSDVAFALYRLPNSTSYNLIVSNSGFEEIDKVDFGVLDSGFVYVPYNSNYSKPLYLRADFRKEINFTDSKIDISELSSKFNLNFKAEEGFSIVFDNSTSDESTYFTELAEVIRRIQSKHARKVVLSRKKILGKLEGRNFFSGFLKLCELYPDAMVSLVFLPNLGQTWLGATPEILVSEDKENVFTTMSLAGTQSAFDKEGNEIKPIDALWTHKEIEEQAMVGRYIINCLKQIRVREFDEEGPKTVKAGNLLHLRTYYKIDNKEVNFPNLSSVMLDLLHPTPAVCGMPKSDAEKVISETEKYNREFYSGYLGPVNIDSESHLFVNLRTMKIEDGMVYTYAGGGILEDSNPEKEWNETELKMATVAKVFS